MSRSCQDKFSLHHELVRHALSNGIRACARQFGCSRNTVREWLRRWRAGDHTLTDRSRRPLNQPARTKPALEKLVIAARKKTPLIFLLRSCLLDAHMGQLLSVPPELLCNLLGKTHFLLVSFLRHPLCGGA
ncbi:MAG: helix-turn-helix domain-containing protein [Puniceicoccales bacterium]|nr:helix-turn-helix domain-containing protein [Puniceicoccales bacterium]